MADLTEPRFIGVVRDGQIVDLLGVYSARKTDVAEGSWVRVEGQVTVLAEPESALGEVIELALGQGHDPFLPAACEAEAAAWTANPGLDDPTLTDLRHLAFVTIDYTTSKDLDQALYIERTDSGGHIVWYALADAAYYVRPGSALFTEALRRGSTYYLPGLTIPMLPLSLCEGIVSINPKVDRRAMVFRMVLESDGVITDTQILRALVHSRDKLAYDGVQAWLDGGLVPTEDAEALESLRALVEVGERRIRQAELRNIVRFRRREVDVHIAGRGMRFVADTASRNDVELYNEQISLMTNVAGARFLRDKGAAPEVVQPIFRTHAPPDEGRLRRFTQQVEGFVEAHDLDPSTWNWTPDGEISLSHFLRKLPESGPHAGVASAIQRQALFTGGRSGFSAEPAVHHGVGADVYARFTAPMREVVGIFVHKETWEKLGLVEASDPTADQAVRTEVIAAANRGKHEQRKLNRETNRMVLDRIFEADLAGKPPTRMGVVMGVTGSKVHVQLDDPAIDVKVYVMDLMKQLKTPLRCDKRQSVLYRTTDKQRLVATGDRVAIVVTGHDPDRDRWVLRLNNLPK